MKLYGALLSPYVRKAALVLAEKGLDYDLANFRGQDGLLPEFLAISPFGKMPALLDGDFALADSSAIAAYLEAEYPQPSLYPASPRGIGRAIWFDEYADTILSASGLKVLFNRFVGPKLLGVAGDEALAIQGESELPLLYEYLESVTPGDGWLVGDQFSIADIAVASMIRSLSYVNVEPKAAQYPQISKWYARICARPAWQNVAEQEAKFKLPE
ncbi:MAG: hypothetical protein RLY97_951 [Pseudomonadota bacterium]